MILLGGPGPLSPVHNVDTGVEPVSDQIYCCVTLCDFTSSRLVSLSHKSLCFVFTFLIWIVLQSFAEFLFLIFSLQTERQTVLNLHIREKK